ncbi:MAG: hypothetical protein AMJ89_04670 [candidate division Zixibacteria bacterium SM23_73]|nr:MAG: hypothetical protein AMJ89_04670 [candidate division Zixibacteria bacterium SM23_73]
MFLLVLFLLLIPLSNSIAESETPEIILENGFYYVVQPNGEKVAIVKEHEPWAPNKAELSPDRQYVVYTTANGLAFECEGRDLFYCKTDGTERTFLHKFDAHVDDWIWVTKDNRNFLIVINKGSMSGPGIWVLDFDKKKLLLRFYGHAVERIEGTDCYKLIGIRKERKICPDELLRISHEETSKPQVFTDWSATQVYLSTERAPILGYKEILGAFAAAYQVLPTDQRILYREILEGLASGNVFFGAEAPSTKKNVFTFWVNSMPGSFNLQKRKVDFLDIGGELSLKAFWSPLGRYLAVLKTESPGIKKLIILGMIGYGVWENVLTKEFSADAIISNLEWSQEDETKIYYSLKEGTVLKDSCVIDLTKSGKK